jgi:hypothetical protein
LERVISLSVRSSPVMRFFGAMMRVGRDECDSKGCWRASRLGRLRPFCPLSMPFFAVIAAPSRLVAPPPDYAETNER